jgi:hypothetical protein
MPITGLEPTQFFSEDLIGYIEKYAESGTRTNVVRFRRPDWDTYRNMPIEGLEPP